jgi:hypothetical protein
MKAQGAGKASFASLVAALGCEALPFPFLSFQSESQRDGPGDACIFSERAADNGGPVLRSIGLAKRSFTMQVSIIPGVLFVPFKFAGTPIGSSLPRPFRRDSSMKAQAGRVTLAG